MSYETRASKISNFTAGTPAAADTIDFIQSGINKRGTIQQLLDLVASVYGASLRTYEYESELAADDIQLGEYAIVEENNYSFYKITNISATGNDIALDSGLTAEFELSLKQETEEYDSVAALITSSPSADSGTVTGYYGGWAATNAGPQGGFSWHKTSGTNSSPTVGTAVSAGSIGGGDGTGDTTGQSVQAGYFWCADGTEVKISESAILNRMQFGLSAPSDTQSLLDVQSFSDLRGAAAAGALAFASRARTKEYSDGASVGGAEYIKDGTTGTANTGDEFKFFDSAGDGWALQHSGTIFSEQFGVFGNNLGTPYDTNFRSFMAASEDASVSVAAFPNRTITFDNSSGAESFRSNCSYVGGKNTFINPSDRTQRVFLTQNKSNFYVSRIRTYGLETSGGESDYIGGGYWRFENCSDFEMNNFEMSRSFGTGIKLYQCSDFKLNNFRTLYNQFTGFELQGCDSYDIQNWKSNKNGRNSSDDSYKDLPSGWTGTHGGRAWVVDTSSGHVDQKFGVIGKGYGEENSEYGGRVFAATSVAATNFVLRDHYYKDNGAPAGTYGTIVLGSDKGVDLLINSDALGESDNGLWENITIDRSLSYGSTISVDGNNHTQRNIKVNLTGSAQYVIAGLAILGGVNFRSEKYQSNGAAIHVSYGSGLPESVTFINDRANDCLKAFNGYPNAGDNFFSGGVYTHRATTAVSGEHGMQISSSQLYIDNCIFDGFYTALETISAAPTARITNTTTKNTVGSNEGVKATSVTDQTDFVVLSCDIDTANPGMFGSYVNAGKGPLGRRRVIWNSNPSTGGTNAGSAIAWSLGDVFENSSGSVGAPKAWTCTTAGTPGTWTSQGNL